MARTPWNDPYAMPPPSGGALPLTPVGGEWGPPMPMAGPLVAIPPRQGATGEYALAAAPGKRPSVVLDVGGEQTPSVSVGLGQPLTLTPMPPPGGNGAGLPPLTTAQAAKGFGATPAAGGGSGGGGMGLQSGGEDLRVVQARVEAQNQGAGPLALVPTPSAQGEKARDPRAGLNKYEREADDLDNESVERERRKRATPGVLLKGGKVQTGETIQGVVGPNAGDLARWRALRAQGAEGEKYLATFDRDLAYRRADDGIRLEEERRRGLEKMEAIDADRRAALGEIYGQIDGLRQRVMNGEVRPDRLWNDAGNAKRGGFFISAALSGIGAALSGKPGGSNSAIDGLFRVMDRDNANQQAAQDERRRQLNDAQQIYKFTADAFESDKAAQHALNIARLEGFKSQADAEYQKLAATMPIYAGRNPDGSAIEKTALDVRLDNFKNAIDQRIAAEDMAMSKELNGQFSKTYGFTQDRYVGGSAGPSEEKIRKTRERQGERLRNAEEKNAKGATASTLYVNGQPVDVGPGVSQSGVDKARDRIGFATDVLSTIGAVESDKRTGRYLAGDPVRKTTAMSLANGLAQMAGGGVASESDKADAAAALDPKDPRHNDALASIRQRANSTIANTLRNVGAKPR